MKKQFYAKLKVNVLVSVAIIFASGLIGRAEAASIGTNVTVSPMRFGVGETVTIKANCAGPFDNVTMFVSVSDGKGNVVFSRSESKGSVPNVVKPLEVKWGVPSDLQADQLSVFVVFLEGNEAWLGQSGAKPQLKVIARCTKPPAGIGRAQCKYATAKYWITTTTPKKVNPL